MKIMNASVSLIKPLRVFVSGVGGTGKSFLIETTKALVNNEMI